MGISLFCKLLELSLPCLFWFFITFKVLIHILQFLLYLRCWLILILIGVFVAYVFSTLKGHTTMSCPHRVTTEHGVMPAPHKNTQNPVEFIFERQLRPRITSVSIVFAFLQ